MLPPEDSLQSRITAAEFLANTDVSTPIWKRALVVIISILLDVAVPVACYFIFRIFLDPILALFISGLPALAIFIVKVIWKRQVSAIALMVFFSFIISAAAAFGTDDPRQSISMGVIGLFHVVSLVPFPTFSVKCNWKIHSTFVTFSKGPSIKPAFFYICKQLLPQGNINPLFTGDVEIDKYTWLWDNIPKFRVHLRIVTGVLGVCLLFEFTAKVIMIFSSLDVDQVVLYSNILLAIVTIFTVLFLVVYVILAKKSVYKHVDKWLTEHYVASQSPKVIIVNSERSPLL